VFVYPTRDQHWYLKRAPNVASAMKGSLADILKPTAFQVVVYLFVLATDSFVQFVSPYWGAWLTIILLFWQLSYLLKISEGTRRFTRHEFLPVLGTLSMAVIFHQGLDYAFGLLSVGMLAARFVDLDTRPTKRRRSHRIRIGSRRAGPATKKSRSRSPRLTRRM